MAKRAPECATFRGSHNSQLASARHWAALLLGRVPSEITAQSREKRIFVIAVTAAEATVRHTTLHRAYRNVWRGDVCTWLCIGALCAGFFAGGLVVLLAARLPTDKHTAL